MSSVIKPLEKLGYIPRSAKVDFKDLDDIEISYGEDLLQLLDRHKQVSGFTLLTEQHTEFAYVKEESGEDARWELYSIKLPDGTTLKMEDIDQVRVKPETKKRNHQEYDDIPVLKSRSS